MTTRRAAWLLGVAAALACNMRPARTEGPGTPCSSQGQCSGGTCYAGLCRARATQLPSIYAEVRTSDPTLGSLQVNGIDPQQSPVVAFSVPQVLTVRGAVNQLLDAGGTVTVANAAVVLTDTIVPIPGRGRTVSVQTNGAGGFMVTVPPSTWELVVHPPDSPPLIGTAATQISASVPALGLDLPERGKLPTVSGTIKAGTTNPPLGGALVAAITHAGELLTAKAQTTNPDGTFSLVLPLGPPEFFLQIGPADAGSTIPTFSPFFFMAGTTSVTIDVGDLPGPASLSGQVVDANGAGIPGARVQALSTDVTATGWIMSRQANADANGNYSLAVRVGNYVVEAVPGAGPDQPALSGEIGLALSAGSNTRNIECPPKVQAVGTVLRPDNKPAGAGYQLVATRLPERLVTGRSGFTTATDASGTFRLVGDRGRYRLEVLPPPETDLPRTFVVAELKGGGGVETLSPIQIASPVELIGTVVQARTQSPIVAAAVEFFALDSTGQRAVSIGSALTDPSGGYRVVLADSAHPTGP